MSITTGTDKQITWASSIKSTVVSHLKTEAERYADWPDYAEIEAPLTNLLAALDKKTDAKWWIDNRTSIAVKLTQKLVA